MTAWRTRTATDLIGYTGLRTEESLSHEPAALDQLWQRAVDEWGFGRADVSTTGGLLLVDLRWHEGRWIVLAQGRGTGFGTQGLLQLVQAPEGIDAADVWHRVQVARDDRGWLSPGRLGEASVPAPPTRAAGSLVAQLLGGATTVVVPAADVVEAVGGTLRLLPEHLLKDVTWSNGHLPTRDVVGLLVTGDPSSSLGAPASRSWARVRAALDREAPLLSGLTPVVDWLVAEGARRRFPARPHLEADLHSLAVALWHERPRSEKERLADHGLEPYDPRAVWNRETVVLIDKIKPRTLERLVRATPSLGARIVEEAGERPAEAALGILLAQCAHLDPFGLAAGRAPARTADLLSRLKPDERRTTVVRVVEEAQVSAEQRLALGGWFEECGVSRGTAPELYPFDIDDAAGLLRDGSTQAFVDLVKRAQCVTDVVRESIHLALGSLSSSDVVTVLDACYRHHVLRDLDEVRGVMRAVSTPNFHLETRPALEVAHRDVVLALLQVSAGRDPRSAVAVWENLLPLVGPPGLQIGEPDDSARVPMTPAQPVAAILAADKAAHPAPRQSPSQSPAGARVKKPRPTGGTPRVADQGEGALPPGYGEPGSWQRCRAWLVEHGRPMLVVAVVLSIAALTWAVRVLEGDASVPSGSPTAITTSAAGTRSPGTPGYTVLESGRPGVDVMLDPSRSRFVPDAVAVLTATTIRITAPPEIVRGLPVLSLDGQEIDRPAGVVVRFDRAGTYQVSIPATGTLLVVSVQRREAREE